MLIVIKQYIYSRGYIVYDGDSLNTQQNSSLDSEKNEGKRKSLCQDCLREVYVKNHATDKCPECGGGV